MAAEKPAKLKVASKRPSVQGLALVYAFGVFRVFGF